MSDRGHGDHLEASHARRPDFQLDDRPIAGGPPTVPDSGWWSRVDKRHRGWIAAGGIAGVVLVAVGVGVAVAMIGSSLTTRRPGFTPSGAKEASAPATIPVSVSTSVTTRTTGATGSATPTGTVARTRLVAFRKSGAVWVAGQDGSDPRMLFPSASGEFALSPDGGTLAVIDQGSTGSTLSVVDVASGRSAVVGSASSQQMGWAPDSSFLVYTTPDPATHDGTIERVARDGAGLQAVGPGSAARVAPDGSIVAISAQHTNSGNPAVVYRNGTSSLIGKNATVVAVAPLAGRVVFADAGAFLGTKRPSSLDSIAYDGSDQTVLVSKPSAAAAYFGVIVPSPDGSWIAYTESGDDGYSRMFAIQPSGGKSVSLSFAQDDYILGWNSDGSEILFIEGNQVQNEATRLMAVRPDGTKRRIIIDGAGD